MVRQCNIVIMRVNTHVTHVLIYIIFCCFKLICTKITSPFIEVSIALASLVLKSNKQLHQQGIWNSFFIIKTNKNFISEKIFCCYMVRLTEFQSLILTFYNFKN